LDPLILAVTAIAGLSAALGYGIGSAVVGKNLRKLEECVRKSVEAQERTLRAMVDGHETLLRAIAMSMKDHETILRAMVEENLRVLEAIREVSHARAGSQHR